MDLFRSLTFDFVRGLELTMIAQAIKWVGGVDGFLEVVDQRRLPGEFVKVKCRNVEQVFEAIGELVVRGAPAIGVTAAYGLVLAMQEPAGDGGPQGFAECLSKASARLASSRPTAVNLSWALERVRQAAERFVSAGTGTDLRALQEFVLAQANTIYDEDVQMCRRIGENGQKFISEGAGILTHCNAGVLATAGQGTALSVLYEAQSKGRSFKVYVDETRPLLQGARLTAWELKQADIDAVVICDNAAGWLMKQGKVDLVITGADRIAANGDTANKIGTYSLSILAKANGVAFYVAAPSSTFDMSIDSGSEIPIEQRAAVEVTEFAGRRIVPDGIGVYNPAFDVTVAENITAIITEKGVIERPKRQKIAEHLKKR